jgi:prepilin-type N-terminal cleavage/methylation domain-containing protein
MKLTHHSHQSGFTLAEILTAMAIAVVIFAAIITASLAMQKTFKRRG